MKPEQNNSIKKRLLVFRVRANADEIKTLKEEAGKEGVTLSDYVREKLSGENEGINRKDFIRLLAELGKQGSNLNQIAKAMNVWVNTGKDPNINPSIIQHCLLEINRLSQELLQLITHGHRRKN